MPESQRDIEAAHERLLRDSSYQTDLPVQKAAEPPEPSQTSNWLAEFLHDVFTPLGPVLKWVLIFGACAILAYILFNVARALYERRDHLANAMKRKKKTDLSEIDVRPDEQFAADLLTRADALASEGKYGEAIHLLLHSSIRDMQEKVQERIGISLTAREIGRMGSMPDTSRSALQRIIHKVEIFVFGQTDISADAWNDARADYSEFAFRGAAK